MNKNTILLKVLLFFPICEYSCAELMKVIPCDENLAKAALSGFNRQFDATDIEKSNAATEMEEAMAKFTTNSIKIMNNQPKAITPFIEYSDIKKINEFSATIYAAPSNSQKYSAVEQINSILYKSAIKALENGIDKKTSEKELTPLIGDKVFDKTIRNANFYRHIELNEQSTAEVIDNPFKVNFARGCPQCDSPDPIGAGGDVVFNLDKLPKYKIDTMPPFKFDMTADLSCSKARRKLKDSVSSINGSLSKQNNGLEEFIKFYRTTADSSDKNKIEAAGIDVDLKNYVSSCLTTENPQSIETEKKVTQIVGALGIGKNRVCTATRISKSEILTARHCFMTTDETGEPMADMSAKVIKEHWFEFEGDQSLRYQVCELLRPKTAGSYKATKDFVVAKIATPASDVQTIKTTNKELKVGDYLYVPGLNLAADQSVPFKPSATLVDGCRISVITPSCIIHGCQTISGTSGAPIFVLRNHSNSVNLELAGLHIAGRRVQGEIPSYCAMNNTLKVVNSPNIGLPVVLFEDILSEAKK